MKKYTMLTLLASTLLLVAFFSNCKKTDEPLTTFYLVRHAEKAQNSIDDPDLSEAGQQRALLIAILMKPKNVERLYATSYKRTQQTLEPLAEPLGLKINIYDPKDPESTTKMIAECKGKTVLIAGHSNSTPKLANMLIGQEIYPDLDESDYSKMWEIIMRGDKVVEHKVIVY